MPVSVADRIWAWAPDVHAKQTRISIRRDRCFNTGASLASGCPWRWGVAPLCIVQCRVRGHPTHSAFKPSTDYQ
jgi:hypothetical protein